MSFGQNNQEYSTRCFGPPPVAIGGLGGSGTRLIAELIKRAGFFMGSDLNNSVDNLWFTLLFRRREILAEKDEHFLTLLNIFQKAMAGLPSFSNFEIEVINRLAATERKPLSSDWLTKRAHGILSNKTQLTNGTRWGWKEPNTHIILDRLIKHQPNLQYIHVIRNGLNMAYSKNQNQLRNWGSFILGEEVSITPRNSLRFWCEIHERVFQIGQEMGSNFLLISYDDFCRDPQSSCQTLGSFLSLNHLKLLKIANELICPLQAIAKYRHHDTSLLDSKDIQYVSSLGFETT